MFGKKEPGFYELESKRLQEKLANSQPGTDEYQKTMDELVKLQGFAGKEKEMKSFISKDAKGNIIGKVVGFLGLGALTLGVAGFEMGGNMFTGLKEKSVGNILSLAARLFKG